MREEKIGKHSFKGNTVLIGDKVKKGIIILVSTLLIIYLGMSLYFINHFYIGSKPNGINISGKTLKQADELITSKTKDYLLLLNERGDKQEKINAADLGLKYNTNDKLQEFKNNQKPFGWILAFFKEQNIELSGIISFDENMLNKALDKLNCITSKDIVKPENPKLKYTESGYEIIDEVNGNKVNRDSLYNAVKDAILIGKTEISLDSLNCYEKPKFTAKAKEVSEAKNIADKYITSKVTYTFGDSSEVLDKSTIHKWITVDDNFEVVFNESKVKEYLIELNDKYGTCGKERLFKTTSKGIKKVGGMVDMIGENKADPDEFYGWSISISKEKQALIDTIKNGQSITKEPKYWKTANSHDANDIGDTYVEIDLTAQHLWFYKNGSLVVDGNTVTGAIVYPTNQSNVETPPGVYSLKEKIKDKHLQGPDGKGGNYDSYVRCWMPFNRGIGLHDADWREVFGSNIYISKGSHGCVNLPIPVAQKIFENIEVGTPIVVYK